MSTREDMLREQVSALPLDPGVYQFLDRNGTIIYVGKAKSLRKRVSSYFVKNKDHSAKVQVLVKQICWRTRLSKPTSRDTIFFSRTIRPTRGLFCAAKTSPAWSPQDNCATMARSISDLMVRCQCNALYWSLFARLFR